MKWKFEPSDFDSDDAVVDIANAKLDEWRRSATVVYANLNFPPDMNPVWGVAQDADTHRALLIDIEALPKEECKHEPRLYEGWYDAAIDTTYCRHCGVKLKATWSEDK